MRKIGRSLSTGFLWLFAAATLFGAERVVDVRDFGAKPDGKTLCTPAIQKAIDRCADGGGGTVYLPPGTWLSGTIFLKSHVTLRLDAGCTLLGSPNPEDYPPKLPGVRSYTDNYVRQSLIAGEGLEHVAIRGRGTIDSDDDALCLKSTLDRACENVTTSNCVLSSHCNAIKMGTESHGGFQNIAITNCTICAPRYSKSTSGAQRGLAAIALEIVDGGHLDRVTISNITIRGVATPIFMRLGNRARIFKKDMPKPGVGTFQNVLLSNVVATHAARIGCSITGLPGHRMENIKDERTNGAAYCHHQGCGSKTDRRQEKGLSSPGRVGLPRWQSASSRNGVWLVSQEYGTGVA